MAFGFGFNKQKALSAAEKFVQQGKLQNAIAEYEKVRKHDEKDLTVANTIGDLYARLGDSVKAIECFKTVGDAYAAQGFTVKGIAMYKKITKLHPSVDGSLKLAELYTQQGLFNDARAQYLQVADDFMKNGELEQAVRLFQKVLEMDPENVPMRIKLAEVYVKLNKKKEAWEVFGGAAEALRARGSLAAAEDVLQRMLVLEPGNSHVLLMRGRSALEGGDWKNAIVYLEKASDIDSHPEGLTDLLKAYLAGGDLATCAPIAEKLLTVHNDPEGLFVLAEGAARLGQCGQALEIYTRHADRLLATDSTRLLTNLHTMITHVRDDGGALEKLLELLKKSGEGTHINEVAELLAHASVRSGNLARARGLYQTLALSEPQNTIHMQNYQQVVERMTKPASAVRQITPEEGALIVEELEATAPVIDQSYPDHLSIAVRSAVTDADLFLSYNLPDKAVGPLTGALAQAPRDVRVNQRLAALHTRFQHFAEAAACCRTLESVYHDAGHPDDAVRYGELAARYEQSPGGGTAAGVPPEVPPLEGAPESAAWPTTTITTTATTASAATDGTEEAARPEFAVQPKAVPASNTQDLSSEWEQALSVAEPAAVGEVSTVAEEGAEANPEIAETVEEIRFYLEHFMTDQARTGVEKLETLTRDAALLDSLRAAIEAGAKSSEEPEVEIAEVDVPEADIPEINIPEINADDLETFQIELKTPSPPETVISSDLMPNSHHPGHEVAEPGHPEPPRATAEHPKPSELTALVADLEASIGNFPVAPPLAAKSPEVEAIAPSGTIEASPAPRPAEGSPGWPETGTWKRVREKRPKVKPEPVAPTSVPAAAKTETKTMPAVTASAGGAAAAPAMSYTPAPLRHLGAGAEAMHPSHSVDLSEMFSELRQELEDEIVVGAEDPETHYNMGAAFREMGLLDEAIAELQTVCTAIDRGHPFGQIIQTYTWLAQCFLDKGVPEAAIRWYEKALGIPGLDNETRLAINYELGSACERAQDRPAALRHFTYVYGANIDYRDVAERIQALKS
ncbi:MAG: tetratricopeptide repeat protein [Terriglobales bacterium]